MSTTALPTEHQEQKAFFEWWEVWGAKLPYQPFAIPNGGARHIAVARKLKSEGVKSGVPDVFLPWPINGFHGLFLEFKRRKGGSVSAAQKEVMESLRKAGYAVEVAHGWEEAARIVKDYAFADRREVEIEPRKI